MRASSSQRSARLEASAGAAAATGGAGSLPLERFAPLRVALWTALARGGLLVSFETTSAHWARWALLELRFRTLATLRDKGCAQTK